MKTRYFMTPEEVVPTWRPATRPYMRWYLDSTPTPYIDETDARQLVLNKFVRPLTGRHDIQLSSALTSLFYGGALLAILTKKGPQDYDEEIVSLSSSALQYTKQHPMDLTVSTEALLQALLIVKDKNAMTRTYCLTDYHLPMLDTVIEWSMRYKMPQLQVLGKALTFAALVVSVYMQLTTDNVTSAIQLGKAMAAREVGGIA